MEGFRSLLSSIGFLGPEELLSLGPIKFMEEPLKLLL